MDFIKKHYEKMLLALALLTLIGSAGWLASKVESLSLENQQVTRRPKPKGKTVQAVDVGSYSNAIASLRQPPLWTNDPSTMFPSARTVRTDINPVMHQEGRQGPGPFLDRVTREPFNLLFKAYTGDGHDFQLNFLSWARTFYVSDPGMEVADHFGKTGYVITKFTQKKVLVNDPNLGTQSEKDVSELTLQHAGEDPIVLVLNQVKEGREPVAWVSCGGGDTRSRPVRRQQTFTCSDATYKVVDINPKQMLISNEKTGESQIIPLSATQ